MPKVSVIIPVYNVEKYLRQCLDSVVNQTLKDIEIICVDDGSTDDSLKILEEYTANDDRFIVIEQENQGAGAARNKGLEIAKGEYLYFMDGDDYLEKDALEKIYLHITKIQSEICVFKNSTLFQSTGELIPCDWQSLIYQIPQKVNFNKYDIPNDFFNFCNIPAWTKMYKTSFIKSNKIKFQNLKTCNDVYFNYISLVLANSITFLNESLITWRTGHSNMTKTRGEHVYCVLQAFKAIKKDLSKEDFKLLNETFYKRAFACFNYELSQLSDAKKKKYWEKKMFKFLPEKYWTNDAVNIKNKTNIWKTIFSIQNKNGHKVITILGLKLKFKSKTPIINNYVNNEKFTIQNNLYLKEIFYANVLRDSIQDSEWLRNKTFTLTGGAANYSFIFTLFKVLDELNPSSILEFGLGQTTKVSTQFANNKNQNCVLDIIEHNADWINIFSKNLNFQNANINIHQKKLINFELKGIQADKYDDLSDVVQNKKYELVIIDGPFGFDRKYPRTNILDLISNNLAENFVIILDDAERNGEKNTADLIFSKLNENNINYIKSYKQGIKTQLLITSSNYEFIHWI